MKQTHHKMFKNMSPTTDRRWASLKLLSPAPVFLDQQEASSGLATYKDKRQADNTHKRWSRLEPIARRPVFLNRARKAWEPSSQAL